MTTGDASMYIADSVLRGMHIEADRRQRGRDIGEVFSNSLGSSQFIPFVTQFRLV